MDHNELIIFQGDGTFDVHAIDKPSMALGRAPGNDIVLPTSAASRYHAHVNLADDGTVTLEDLGTVNGTFVDDELLKPNASVTLEGGEEIRIGDVRLVFRAVDPVGPAFQQSVDETWPGASTDAELVVTLEQPDYAIAPGSQALLVLAIENRRSEAVTCDVAVSGIEGDWIRVDRQDVHLDGASTGDVLISVRPPEGPATTPGSYELVVRVTPRDNAAEAIEKRSHLEIVGYHSLSVAVTPRGKAAHYDVVVHNLGNLPATLWFEGWHPDGVLRYDFDHSDVTLAPGESGQVALSVRPARKDSVSEPTTFAVVTHLGAPGVHQGAIPIRYDAARGRGGGSAGFSVGGWLPIALALILSGSLIGVGLAGGYAFYRDRLLRPFSARDPTAIAIPPSEPAPAGATEAPAPSPFPAPSAVSATLVPSEVIRYQDSPITLQYAITVGTPVRADELALTLFDEASQTTVAQFTVADFAGEIDLSFLLGDEWRDALYTGGASMTYTLRASVRGSAHTASPVAMLTVRDVSCVVAAGISLRAGPGLTYPPAEPPLPLGDRVQPVAQTTIDGEVWYSVEPGDTPRWLGSEDLDCTLAGVPWQPPAGFAFVAATDIPPTLLP